MASEPTQLLSLREVMAQVNVGRSTIYRWMEAGRFPKPIKLTDTTNRWREIDIENWVEACVKRSAA